MDLGSSLFLGSLAIRDRSPLFATTRRCRRRLFFTVGPSFLFVHVTRLLSFYLLTFAVEARTSAVDAFDVFEYPFLLFAFLRQIFSIACSRLTSKQIQLMLQIE